MGKNKRAPTEKGNDFDTYVHYIEREPHDYGEVIDSINFEEDVFEEVDGKHFVQGMVEFLKEERKDLVEGKKRSSVFDIAKKIYRRRGQGTGFRKREIIELVEEAIGLGYIWKFKLEEPWHPKIFLEEDRLTTFPFQHKYIVGYSGQPKHIFFHSEGKNYILRDQKANFEQFRNPESVLSQGRLRAGSSHEDAEKGGADGNEALDRAIWFSCFQEANTYPRGVTGLDIKDQGKQVYTGNVTLEVIVPSNFAVHHTEEERWETTEDLKNDFGNPSHYRDRVEYLWRDADSYDFKVALKRDQKKGKAFLPLKYVEAVWDREEYPNAPHFLPLRKYAAMIKQHFPTRVPDPENMVLDVESSMIQQQKVKSKKKAEFKRKTQELRDIPNIMTNSGRHIEDIKNNLTKSLDSLEDLREKEDLHQDLREIHVKKVIETPAKMFGHAEEYNKLLKHVIEDYENTLGVSIDRNRSNVRNIFNGFKLEPDTWKAEKIAENANNIIETMIKEQRSVYNSIENGSLDKSVHKAAKNLERQLGRMLSSQPLIIVDEKDVELFIKMSRKFVKTEEINFENAMEAIKQEKSQD